MIVFEQDFGLKNNFRTATSLALTHITLKVSKKMRTFTDYNSGTPNTFFLWETPPSLGSCPEEVSRKEVLAQKHTHTHCSHVCIHRTELLSLDKNISFSQNFYLTADDLSQYVLPPHIIIFTARTQSITKLPHLYMEMSK